MPKHRSKRISENLLRQIAHRSLEKEATITAAVENAPEVGNTKRLAPAAHTQNSSLPLPKKRIAGIIVHSKDGQTQKIPFGNTKSIAPEKKPERAIPPAETIPTVPKPAHVSSIPEPSGRKLRIRGKNGEEAIIRLNLPIRHFPQSTPTPPTGLVPVASAQRTFSRGQRSKAALIGYDGTDPVETCTTPAGLEKGIAMETRFEQSFVEIVAKESIIEEIPLVDEQRRDGNEARVAQRKQRIDKKSKKKEQPESAPPSTIGSLLIPGTYPEPYLTSPASSEESITHPRASSSAHGSMVGAGGFFDAGPSAPASNRSFTSAVRSTSVHTAENASRRSRSEVSQHTEIKSVERRSGAQRSPSEQSALAGDYHWQRDPEQPLMSQTSQKRWESESSKASDNGGQDQSHAPSPRSSQIRQNALWSERDDMEPSQDASYPDSTTHDWIESLSGAPLGLTHHPILGKPQSPPLSAMEFEQQSLASSSQFTWRSQEGSRFVPPERVYSRKHTKRRGSQPSSAWSFTGHEYHPSQQSSRADSRFSEASTVPIFARAGDVSPHPLSSAAHSASLSGPPNSQDAYYQPMTIRTLERGFKEIDEKPRSDASAFAPASTGVQSAEWEVHPSASAHVPSQASYSVYPKTSPNIYLQPTVESVRSSRQSEDDRRANDRRVDVQVEWNQSSPSPMQYPAYQTRSYPSSGCSEEMPFSSAVYEYLQEQEDGLRNVESDALSNWQQC